MINVGVMGLGMMGATHLGVYATLPGARVVAVADRHADRLQGLTRAAGNIEGMIADCPDLTGVRTYQTCLDLITQDPQVQLVDICLPTPLHRPYAEAALEAGKHVLIEKPLARTSRDAAALAAFADRAPGLAMVGMCMRFWPGWVWLKDAVSDGRYGRVLSAHFRRLASPPASRFCRSGEESGGAILDLHIHDSDFVQHLFGVPDGVFSRGYSGVTSAIDHVVTQYLYSNGPIVSAEGGWAFSEGYEFTMQYTVNFERATALFDLAAMPVLKLIRDGGTTGVEVPPGMGYAYEIAYFLDCIASGRTPERVTLWDGARAIAIVEAEARSVASGRVEAIIPPRAG